MATRLAYLPQVRDQYEDYPYPARNPDDEEKRILLASFDCLDALNYYCYGGRRDFTKGFRVLIAGGGTGDATIQFAEQLRETDAQIIQLDISQASLSVAKARADKRGLTNITFIHDSLLELPRLKLGSFDYINCSGVLHHLADPQAGLDALCSVLKKDGAMGLMVYAPYGRAGVYMMQDMLRIINGDEQDKARKVETSRTLLAALPKDHPMTLSAPRFNDIRDGESGIYDLLLHSQDRAYSIPELVVWLGKSGLSINQMLYGVEPQGLRLYQPASYITDPVLLHKALLLQPVEQMALAELLNGQIVKHTFYASRDPVTKPSAADLDMVPCIPLYMGNDIYDKFYTSMRDAPAYMTVKTRQDDIAIPKSALGEAIFRFMDGNRTIGDIFERVIACVEYAHAKPDMNNLGQCFQQIYTILNGTQTGQPWLYLRHNSVPPYRPASTFQTCFTT